MSTTTLDRLRVLSDLIQPQRPKFNYAIHGMMLQHLANAAEHGTLRKVPRYSGTSDTLRKLAVEEFSSAGRYGFVDC